MLIGTLIGIALLAYCFRQYYCGQPIQWGIVAFVIGVYLGMAIQEDLLTPTELRKLAENKIEQTNGCASGNRP
ncbi:hypothetical protein SAMN05216404_106192 [Nitrosospira multiformis]|uniref:Uncharacterized protein n=2 Tax=Nitrosospira multiformis TaxID=1231 RepID=A0A1H8IU77_9PROT|nr:hypothetical protein SAMN05216404_106192 [Nitrosospira multiformis]